MEYKKYLMVAATPEEVYAALTNALSLKLMTGAEAEFIKEPGTEFTLYDGDIAGRNLRFEENKLIAQEWYFGDNPPSEVLVKLHAKQGETSLEWRQTGIPEEDFEDFTAGLNDEFFTAITDFF